MDMPQAPGQMPPTGEDAAEAASGAVEYCIKVMPDGSMSVYQEGGQGSQPERPVADIGQALKEVLAMYRAKDGDGEDQFAAGFGQAGPKPSAAPPREMMA